MFKAGKFQQLLRDATSDDPLVRGSATQALVVRAASDRASHAVALPVFRSAMHRATDAWTLTNAARGIETIAGPEEGRAAWLSLLAHRDPDVIASAALGATDRFYCPTLLQLLDRAELKIRGNALRTLGRMRDASAFDALVAELDRPDTRADAVDALADFGDPRAIPHLERLLDDKTGVRQEDNHGPMLRMCDIAQDAIARLRRPAVEASSLQPIPFASRAAPTASSGQAAGPAFAPMSEGSPVQQWPRGFRFDVLVPLLLVGFEFFWIGGVIIWELYTRGRIAPDRATTIRLDLIMMFPVAIGLLIGLGVLALRHPHRTAERVVLYIGSALCALFTLPFIHGMLH